MVERKVESKIRRRFDQLYDDLTGEGYDKDDVEELLNGIEDDLITQLEDFEQEDEDEE